MRFLVDRSLGTGTVEKSRSGKTSRRAIDDAAFTRCESAARYAAIKHSVQVKIVDYSLLRFEEARLHFAARRDTRKTAGSPPSPTPSPYPSFSVPPSRPSRSLAATLVPFCPGRRNTQVENSWPDGVLRERRIGLANDNLSLLPDLSRSLSGGVDSLSSRAR